jgi:proline iminopeptidase
MSHTYPPLRPFATEMIAVGQGHTLYLEQSGNPNGIPVLYLHGGPGAGLNNIYRSLFDPEVYHIIGFDQRGCGRSTPFADTESNNSDFLLQDIQLIRKYLHIEKWMLCGGSWGATLALLAAIDKPKTVSSIILRGTFLARDEDFSWFLDSTGCAAQIFPEYYEQFLEHADISHPEESLLQAYDRIFTSADELTQTAAAKAWCIWEARISQVNTSVTEQDLCQDLHQAISLAMLECHYLKNRCFIAENFILDNVKAISAIPGTIIHGRYDMVCKMQGAYQLRQKWRNSQLLIVPESGHSVSEPLVAEALCHATDAMAKFIKEEHH